MALVYFHPTALVKLLVEEQGSDLAAQLWDSCDAALSSRLAYPEVRSALAVAGRNHNLDEDALRSAGQVWEKYWAAIRPVELTPVIERHAGQLARRHALCGADYVHLASALEIAQEIAVEIGKADLALAVWDRKLHASALAAGLRVAPARLDESKAPT